MALKLEDGDASQAQRDLRAAEQKLREALQRGASDEELRKLTQELRDAAERYMRDLAQQAPQQQNDADAQAAAAGPRVDARPDGRHGAQRRAPGRRGDARQMQNMFENMRGAESAQEDQASREMRKQMDELGKLLRDQQALRDDTFRQDQRDQLGRVRRTRMTKATRASRAAIASSPATRGPTVAAGSPARSARPPRRIARRLKSLGMKGEKGFDDAQGDMKEAEGELKGDGEEPGPGPGRPRPERRRRQGGLDEQGRTGKGRAVEAQGRALEALRKGAQGMQQQAQGRRPRRRTRLSRRRAGGRAAAVLAAIRWDANSAIAAARSKAP